MPLRILLADDDDNLRGMLRSLVESHPGWEVVAEAVDGRDAAEKAARFHPDVLVLDYSMPELDTITVIARTRRSSPQTEVVILSMHDLQFTVRRAVDAGACGYVLKAHILNDLLPAIKSASEHKPYVRFGHAGLGISRSPGSPNEGPQW